MDGYGYFSNQAHEDEKGNTWAATLGYLIYNRYL
jgi:hypothetical protein